MALPRLADHLLPGEWRHYVHRPEGGDWSGGANHSSGHALASTMCSEADIADGVWECETERYVMLVGSPILMLLGTFGNAITFAVMAASGLRFGPTACYLQALAVSDTLTLWIGLGRHFYKRLTWVDIRNVSPIACQLQRFLLYASMDCSAWYLVALTVDRFVAVCFPLRKSGFTVSRAKIAICATATACCLFNVHVFWTRGLEEMTEPSALSAASSSAVTAATSTAVTTDFGSDSNGTSSAVTVAAKAVAPENCGYPGPLSRDFWMYTQGWVAMLKYSIVPSALMLVLNACIIRKLRAQGERMSARGKSDRHATSSDRKASLASQGPPRLSVPKLTAMLLACTMFFLCVGAPAYVYNSCELLIYQSVNDPRQKGRLELIDAAVTLLNYLNHAANFFLYATIGVGFRHEVKKLLCRCRAGLSSSAAQMRRASSLRQKSSLPLL